MKVIRLLVCGVACALMGACDATTDAFLPPGPLLADEVSVGADHFSDWSTPVNLGPLVNSPFTDFTPELSRDGLSLYFSSNRPGGFGLTDLYVARRIAPDPPWGPPVNLGAAVNSSGFEGGMTLRLPELYVASDRADPGPDHPLHIYLSVIGPDGAFGPAVLVPELSSEGNDLRPTIRFDGRALFLSSNRAGSAGGSQDIWVSTRRAFGAPWTTPINLGAPVNTEFNEVQPSLSADGRILLFASDRPGGSGGVDLYMATRAR